MFFLLRAYFDTYIVLVIIPFLLVFFLLAFQVRVVILLLRGSVTVARLAQCGLISPKGFMEYSSNSVKPSSLSRKWQYRAKVALGDKV